MTTEDIYCVPKQKAEDRISAWLSGKYTIVPSSQPGSSTQLRLDSFLFSIEDFTDFAARVQAVPGYNITGVVCKLGIKENPIEKARSTTPFVPCLIFEAMDGFSVVPPAAPSVGNELGDLPPLDDPDGAAISARYDFSYPCPPTCPPNEMT